MAEKKTGYYFDGSITKQGPMEYTEDDLVLTEAINTSRTVATLERQVDLYAQEVEAIKKSARHTKIAAIVSAIISFISVIATIICAIITNTCG